MVCLSRYQIAYPVHLLPPFSDNPGHYYYLPPTTTAPYEGHTSVTHGYRSGAGYDYPPTTTALHEGQASVPHRYGPESGYDYQGGGGDLSRFMNNTLDVTNTVTATTTRLYHVGL